MLLLIIFNKTNASMANIARYKISITLNNSDTIICFIQFADYNEKIYELNEKEIYTKLKSNNIISLYKRIQTINYPKGHLNIKEYKYPAAALSDIVEIDTRKIKKIEKISVFKNGEYIDKNNRDESDSSVILFTYQIIEICQEKCVIFFRPPL